MDVILKEIEELKKQIKQLEHLHYTHYHDGNTRLVANHYPYPNPSFPTK